jgi:hypothetical protein
MRDRAAPGLGAFVTIQPRGYAPEQGEKFQESVLWDAHFGIDPGLDTAAPRGKGSCSPPCRTSCLGPSDNVRRKGGSICRTGPAPSPPARTNSADRNFSATALHTATRSVATRKFVALYIKLRRNCRTNPTDASTGGPATCSPDSFGTPKRRDASSVVDGSRSPPEVSCPGGRLAVASPAVSVVFIADRTLSPKQA